MPRYIKKLLKELKKELVRIYGNELKAIYLYGSYARKEAHPLDSDVDLLLVLKGNFNPVEALKRSDDFIASTCLENDIVVSRAFVSEEDYASKQTPFLINVRRDALAL